MRLAGCCIPCYPCEGSWRLSEGIKRNTLSVTIPQHQQATVVCGVWCGICTNTGAHSVGGFLTDFAYPKKHLALPLEVGLRRSQITRGAAGCERSYSCCDAQLNIPRCGALGLLPPGSAGAQLHSGGRGLPSWRELATSVAFVFVTATTASRTSPGAPDALCAGSRKPPRQNHRGCEPEQPSTQAFLPGCGAPAGGRRRRFGTRRNRNLGSRACC